MAYGRGLTERPLRGTITVPCAPEAPLSGIAASDSLNPSGTAEG